ncbi:MAG: Uma2 family endonuclease [Rubrivivax sp.]|jgi:Uma2 family endonuclease|nr:Uma2 family endonuclease [Rubrivivax sp.]
MGTMTWADVMANPFLKDLPFKIELNRWGRIEMSPASNQHGRIQSEIAGELSRRPGGVVYSECSIQTTDGVRVADVAWISDERLAEMGEVTPFPRAPEICVEIMSPSNSWGEMHIKTGLYLEAGAREVWVQGVDGQRTVMGSPVAS